jgi:hypothetical protein
MDPTRTLALLSLTTALLVVACSERTHWIEDGDDDTVAIDDDDDQDDDDTVASCPLPVPDHVTLDHPVWGDTAVRFYVPHAGWALAALHASRQLEGLAEQDIDLRLDPAWFFAVALEASFMGCSDDTPPDPEDSSNQYDRQEDTDATGCLDLPQSTIWLELCRMYPDELDCTDGNYEQVIPSVEQATTGRDNVEPGILGLAWYTTVGYAQLQGAGAADPDAWFAEASDPRALEKVAALLHLYGPWYEGIADVVAGCQSATIEDCLGGSATASQRTEAVAAHVDSLEAGLAGGQCYDGTITPADLNAYIEAIAVLWPDGDWATAQLSAMLLLDGDGEPFQQVAGELLDAIDEASGVALRCPGAELSSWYGTGCPP